MDWQRFETRWLFHEITEGRMRGKPKRGRRIIQMLHDLANDGGIVALKLAAEDREGWRQEKDVKNLLYNRRLLNWTEPPIHFFYYIHYHRHAFGFAFAL